MKRFKNSIAAWSLALALASFAGLYNLLPYDMMVNIATALAFGFMFAVACRYTFDGLRALRDGRRAGEFIVVAVFATYLVLSFRQGWVWFVQANTPADGHRPEWLINTVMSVFFPWMGAWAAFCALVAPDIGVERISARPAVWLSVALFLAGLASGFVLASSFQPPVVIESHARCSDTDMIWGSSNKIYHTQTSPYRGLIRSGWCFKSIQQAQAAGFRAPR